MSRRGSSAWGGSAFGERDVGGRTRDFRRTAAADALAVSDALARSVTYGRAPADTAVVSDDIAAVKTP